MGFKRGPVKGSFVTSGALRRRVRISVVALGVCFCGFLALSAVEGQAADYKTPTTPFTNPAFGVTNPTLFNPDGFTTCNQDGEGVVDKDDTYTFYTMTNTYQLCRVVSEGDDKQAERLFWVTMETIKAKEAQETGNTYGLESKYKLENLEASNSLHTTRLNEINAKLGENKAVLVELLAAVKALPKGITEQTVSEPLAVAAGSTLEVSDTATQAAVVSDAETANQNLWGIAGLATAGFLLFAFYRMVKS